MKKILTFSFICFFAAQAIAQTEKELSHEFIQEMGKTLDKLSEDDTYQILGKAISQQGNNAKKELSKVLSSLSEQDRKAVLRYAESLTKTKNPYTEMAPPPSPKSEMPKMPLTSIKFDNQVHEFGQAKEGDKVTHTYTFTNTGTNPLIISNAKGSCGCTVPKWSKEPIAPGGKGEINIVFNTKGKSGKQTKMITVTANIPSGKQRLTVKGEVEKKKEN